LWRERDDDRSIVVAAPEDERGPIVAEVSSLFELVSHLAARAPRAVGEQHPANLRPAGLQVHPPVLVSDPSKREGLL
jgi:hypothetical protein